MSHEIYHNSSTDQDLLPIVDEYDVVIGTGTRKEIHAQRLRHRAVHVVVVDGRGKLLLQLRSHRKDSHPGWWDISVGGHVDAGEEYDTAVVREIREELGLVGTPLMEVAQRPAAPESGWEFVRIYECVTLGPFNHSPSEIDALRWVDIQELLTHGSPTNSDHQWRITGSGLLSIRAWAAARGHC